ncbi:substrate-binding domain-containing protein [Gracilimonas sp.]|uniref:substrate-binding domain-containing protein n=1 Tax=Gracilimonas sp. TaxID=1974203 RepID=UPI003753E4A3
MSVNDRDSSRQITEHLIKVHGHARVAHLSGPRAISIGKKRFEGYKDALQAHHLPVEEKWIIECGFREEAGYKGMNKLLSLPKNEHPTAIVAVNDPVAFGAIKAIEEAGYSIPDDFAIAGFTDDIRAPLLKVPLTTVHQFTYDVGKRAAKKLLQVINDSSEATENIEVLTELKIRNLCGC